MSDFTYLVIRNKSVPCLLDWAGGLDFTLIEELTFHDLLYLQIEDNAPKEAESRQWNWFKN